MALQPDIMKAWADVSQPGSRGTPALKGLGWDGTRGGAPAGENPSLVAQENKFTPSLLGNSSSLSSSLRKEFIPIMSNILKDYLCQVDFTGTAALTKQCSRRKEKTHHLTWIFPLSSLTYKI